nr:hypothetical protein [Nocardiopsis sp. CC223A]
MLASWTGGATRRHAAGVPDTTRFATEPELARQRIAAAAVLEHTPHT